MSQPTEAKEIVLLDGGTGMSLVQMGHSELDTDPLWSASIVQTHPEDLVKLHKEYFVSGSDVVVSATYQASAAGYMKRYNIDEAEAVQLVKKSVQLALDARDQAESVTGRKGFVAASIGPYGAVLCDRSEYHGKYADSMTRQELSGWHFHRMQQVIAMKPDLLAIETIPSLKEAEAILDNLFHFPHIRAWVSFQCKDGLHIAHGEHIQEAVKAVSLNSQVVAVGINCVDPCHVSSLVQSMSQLNLSIPIIAKPNAGQFEDGQNSDKQKTLIADMVEGWVADGASWIGGCCHVYPSDIRDIQQRLKANPSIHLVSSSKTLAM